ncbi:MAG TPA: DUF427 domain-containing protein [Actinomycetes bacterium]|nr:DUF427 domain-containing protein [Actinomycetes bacterium]
MGEKTIADTHRPVLLLETGVVPRWYLPPADIDWRHLEPDPTQTTCQYKGDATYYRVRNSSVLLWTYHRPRPDLTAITGHLCAAAETPTVRLLIDGHIQESHP